MFPYASGFIIVFIILNILQKTCNGQLLTQFNLPRWKLQPHTYKSAGDPLILTPYAEACDDMTARRLSKVDKSLFLNVTSYAGYLTVDEEHNSNLFFWFFPAQGTEHLYEDFDDYDGEDEDTDYDHPFLKKLQKRPKQTDSARLDDEKPVMLWLQGGPGASSLFGLFTENGPFFIDEKNKTKLKKNPYSWHRNYSMIYIDNPVGAGFSFTDSDGYLNNITQTAKHLYTALRQFFDIFPMLKSNDFYISGESFAGKYIPAIGNEIYEENQKDHGIRINLQGLALGNALSDPYNMADYSEYAYQLGLVGLLGYREMKVGEILFRSYIDRPQAKSYWDLILYSFISHSNYDNLYNIKEPKLLELMVYLDFVDQEKIRRALHVGKQEFSDPTRVYLNMIPDFMTTAIHWTERLLNAGLPIMYYSGNWDFIVAYPLSEKAYQLMKWKGAEKYRKAERQVLYVNGELKGYFTKADNFIEAAILNAGHMVPTDQPEACLELIDRFIKKTL